MDDAFDQAAPASPRRRAFLQGGALAGAATIAAPLLPARAQAQTKPVTGSTGTVPAPNVSTESQPPPADSDPVSQTDCGANFMVDVIKTLDLEFIALNPASSFRGLHEAIVNYGGNAPELITCNHEEIATAMAQGYAKIEGKPMGVMAHGTVGLQHASMALYNAYCDRVPVYMMIGNIVDAEKRGLTAEWQHSAQDPAALVRDFLKWDDQPASLQHFAESAARAWQISMTAPCAPVLLSIDAELQENPIPRGRPLHIPKKGKASPPVADAGAIAETAALLVGAANPVLIADRMARTQDGMDRLVELADLLQCAVIDQGGRTNFPTQHRLNQSVRARGAIAQADVVLGLELSDFWATINQFSDRVERSSRALVKPGTKTISLGVRDLFTRSNYQEFGRFQEVDLTIAGDAQESLPLLIVAVRALLDTGKRATFAARGEKLAKLSAAALADMRRNASIGWDSTPITSGRMCAELYDQIKHDDWSLVGQGLNTAWQRRLWAADKTYRFNGNSGGWGIGYNCPGALGGALANRKHGRLSVAIQGDGDFLYAPATLWTAAHHRIPILYVMHNNRAYHQELMYVQSMANRLGRGIRNTDIGNVITNPDIDYATVAKGFGVYSEGPIENPRDLGPALRRALAVVRRGEPALIDVVMDAR